MRKAEKHLKDSLPAASKSYFPTADEIQEKAFRAMHGITLEKAPRSPRVKIKAYNRMKAKAFGESLEGNLRRLAMQFPRIDAMEPFYLDLLGTIVDIGKAKKNLAMLSASSRLIKKLRYNSVRKIYATKAPQESDNALAEFIGRACSVVKKLGPALRQLKTDSKSLYELPTIEFGVPTVVLAGYPNVGKTTILKRLTGANAKIAPYAFTTKQINSGFMEVKYRRVQVLDTPGLLEHTKRNEIERKAIAALRHLASTIVFVFDATEHCGFSMGEQLTLLGHIKKEFAGKKIIVVVNKAELAKPEELEMAKETIEAAMQEPGGGLGSIGVVLEGEGEGFGGNLMRTLDKEIKF